MLERVNSLQPAAATGQKQRKNPVAQGSSPAGDAVSFQQLLNQSQSRPLVISAHARERMESRNIQLEEADISKISEAMEKAEAKGARSSLLLYGEIALLASVTNRTIITAVDGAAEREQVFTGIDSAVILK